MNAVLILLRSTYIKAQLSILIYRLLYLKHKWHFFLKNTYLLEVLLLDDVWFLAILADTWHKGDTVIKNVAQMW